MKEQLTAIKPLTYQGKRILPGETFIAKTRRDAQVLKAIGKAEGDGRAYQKPYKTTAITAAPHAPAMRPESDGEKAEAHSQKLETLTKTELLKLAREQHGLDVKSSETKAEIVAAIRAKI